MTWGNACRKTDNIHKGTKMTIRLCNPPHENRDIDYGEWKYLYLQRCVLRFIALFGSKMKG
jgi:hypothetical protein